LISIYKNFQKVSLKFDYFNYQKNKVQITVVLELTSEHSEPALCKVF
jgi:hypothetical protein